jgi:Na+-driven multidrug efflux pump
MSLAMVTDGIFIGLGDTTTPFALQAGGVALNFSLSFVALVLLDSGIGGIALATICTRGTVGLASLLILAHRLSPGAARAALGRRRRWPRPVLPLWREIVQVGLPVTASTVFYSSIFMVLNRLLASIDPAAHSVLAIGIRGNEAIGFMVLGGFGAAASTLTGAALGRETREAHADLAGYVRTAVLRVLVAAAPIAVGFTVLWLAVPERLCAIYTDDPHLIALSAAYLRLAAIANLFQLLETIFAEGMAGAGMSIYPLMVTVPGNLLRIPLAFLLVAWTGWGLNAVWAAILFSCIFKGMGMLWIFAKASWPEQAARRTRELGLRVAAARE